MAVGHGRPLGSQLQVVHRAGLVGAPDEVQPLLHVVLELELRLVALALGLEEHVEVEGVELAAARDAANLLRHLVGHHDHARQGLVGVGGAGVLARPSLLGTLLVGVGPVVYLLLNELARVERAERRAREEEVVRGLDREVALVHVALVGLAQARVHGLAGVCLVLVILYEEALGVLVPGAEVVLVKDDKVPVLLAHPLVLRLYPAGPALAPQEVLEGAKAHDGPLLVCHLELLRYVRFARRLGTADELPALEVHVRGQVLLPRGLHGRLEGEDQHAPKAHVLGELVGGEGLAEAHLGVPQELGGARPALGGEGPEVLLRLVDRGLLLRPHLEVARAPLRVVHAIPHCDVGCPHVVNAAAEPLRVLAVAVAHALLAMPHQVLVHLVVREGRAVGPHCRLHEDDLVRFLSRLQRGVVLVHALFDGARGVSHLEEALELAVLWFAVGVDDWLAVWAWREELITWHCPHPRSFPLCGPPHTRSHPQ